MPTCLNTYRARCFDVEAGINVAVLNDETARKLNIEKGDRILISYGKKKVLALADYSDKYVRTDEISLFADVSSKLGKCEGKQIARREGPAALHSRGAVGDSTFTWRSSTAFCWRILRADSVSLIRPARRSRLSRLIPGLRNFSASGTRFSLSKGVS